MFIEKINKMNTMSKSKRRKVINDKNGIIKYFFNTNNNIINYVLLYRKHGRQININF